MLPQGITNNSDASFAPVHLPTNMATPNQQAGGSMAVEKCINDFDLNEVIFEEGSTGRELFVVLDARSTSPGINGARHAST
jgi:CRP/FNR family transcriptional regulator, cyclic AMP receptor protein